ncbi:unnamed protein product [Effrenium voratum]|uniref:EF-hand domain-containing protein n=1 Tax=Effrenium voratum TaxID=2562239 RepID=A0AA36N076_9DINO|nr:unnamed protein product [Effrenium voratum]
MSFHHPFVPELEEPETPHAAAPEMKGVGPPPLGTLKSSKTTSSLPRALPDAPPPTVELSDAMQQLLDRVIQQHILELSMADDRVKLAYFEQRVDSVMEDSQEVSVSEMRHRRSTSIGRKKGVQQLRADQVLHAIDHDEAVEELFKADPLQEGFCADEPLHTITASKETKWERFQTFLQSTQFDYITETTYSQEVKDVFLYYGTFSRTFLSMFEILFANWGPPARVLVDNVSEWYSLFFLLYRCVLGFAVINVVNAIFVQQTLKTASSDEELSFKQKEKDIQMYANKVKKLFQTMDFSGDGSINLEEFSKLVKSPKLKFWMSQLELEYHDLLSLFEFLDNGDGEITLTEFIEGAARLRGGAKALDIWRMETKLEVLFEEVLGILKILKVERRPSVQAKEEAASTQSIVQDVFNNSLYKHIQSTSRNRQPSTDKTAH